MVAILRETVDFCEHNTIHYWIKSTNFHELFFQE